MSNRRPVGARVEEGVARNHGVRITARRPHLSRQAQRHADLLAGIRQRDGVGLGQRLGLGLDLGRLVRVQFEVFARQVEQVALTGGEHVIERQLEESHLGQEQRLAILP